MHGELVSVRMQSLAKVTRFSAARLLAICQNDDDAGLMTIVEDLRCPLDRAGEWRPPRRRETADCFDDAPRGILLGWKVERNIALIGGPEP